MQRRPVDTSLKARMSPHLGLLTIAGLVRRAGHEVSVQNGNLKPVEIPDDADLVGITVTVDVLPQAIELAKLCREKRIPVVAGGIGVASDPDTARPHFDAICIGPAEGHWSQLLADVQRGILKREYVTGADLKDTLEWIVRNRIETVTSHILTPYPGTALYERMKVEGRLTDDNLSNYDTAHVVFKPKCMTAQELYDGYLWIYREVYSLKNILRRTPKSLSQVVPYYLFNLFYRKYGRFTERLGDRIGFDRVGAWARRLSYWR